MNLRYLSAAAPIFVITACHHVSTSSTLIDPSLRLAKTCPAAVKLFTTTDRIEQPYSKVALLNSTGQTSYSNENQLIQSMREKAAAAGANGIILNGIDEPSSMEKIAGQVAQIGADAAGQIVDISAQRKGRAIAIYIPSDSARTFAACAKSKK